jgi:rsbT antagonist protein RsbS
MIQGMHLTPIGRSDVLLEPTESLDPSRRDAPLEALLGYLQDHGARRLIYDLRNVSLIDAVYYDWLRAIHAICRISGIQFVTVNMRPVAAYALASRLKEDPPFECALDVQRLEPLPPEDTLAIETEDEAASPRDPGAAPSPDRASEPPDT